ARWFALAVWLSTFFSKPYVRIANMSLKGLPNGSKAGKGAIGKILKAIPSSIKICGTPLMI
ncbi:MAG: hypothetical protein SAJ12_12770, partial [Jaaginema sp. PMC 1079.18]|nr:hypothetical protein [Jaaginema sp. PMC 1080.18]MEC4851878.1 hypothetical protein [Jaaginema sp. PMC 1079.18]MEC4868267.1 hypothetical protein [Jaaginema sp. PMC 1078.18]